MSIKLIIWLAMYIYLLVVITTKLSYDFLKMRIIIDFYKVKCPQIARLTEETDMYSWTRCLCPIINILDLYRSYKLHTDAQLYRDSLKSIMLNYTKLGKINSK